MHYNHAATISFSFNSKSESDALDLDDVSAIREALRERFRDLMEVSGDTLLDSIEVFDTIEEDD